MPEESALKQGYRYLVVCLVGCIPCARVGFIALQEMMKMNKPLYCTGSIHFFLHDEELSQSQRNIRMRECVILHIIIREV